MPSVTGLGTTFNLPNYGGEILQVTPAETPFLTAIGGLNQQGEVVTSTEFEWQAQDMGEPSQPEILEGADAPTPEERSRTNISNVVQIFQESYGVSYTRQAAIGQMAGVNNAQVNPVADELANQASLALKKVARQLNYSFLRGSYQKPSDNTTGRKTRGLLSAITTNALDNRETAISITGTATTDVIAATAHGLLSGDQVVLASKTGGTGLTVGNVYYVVKIDADSFYLSASRGGTAVDFSTNITAGSVRRLTPLTKVRALNLIQSVWSTYGFDGSAEPTLMVNASLKRALSHLFITQANYQETTRNVGGVNVTQIQTDFGTVNVLLDRVMPGTTIAFTHLAQCKPAYLLVPNKGFLFSEELAKVGAASKFQIYGEAGLWYGAETAHAKIEYVGEIAEA